MAYYETWFKTELSLPLTTRILETELVHKDHLANLIGTELYFNGSPVTVSGEVKGYVRSSANDETIAFDGFSNENKVYIVLPEDAYAIPGPVFVFIRVTENNKRTTVLAVQGNVIFSLTNNTVDLGDVSDDPGTQGGSGERLSGVIARLEDLEEGQTSLGSSISALNTRTGGLETDVGNLTTNTSRISGDLLSLSNDILNNYYNKTGVNNLLSGLETDIENTLASYSTISQTNDAINLRVTGLKFGGRNFLKNSSANVKLVTVNQSTMAETVNWFSSWSHSNNTDIMLSSEFSSAAQVQKHNGQNIIFFRSNAEDVATTGSLYNNSMTDTLSLASGDKITVSLWYYLSSSQKEAWTNTNIGGYLTFVVIASADGTTMKYNTIARVDKDSHVGWNYISKTLTIGTDFDGIIPTSIFRFGAYHHGPGIIRFSEVMIEKSEKASDWYPAPEDGSSAADKYYSELKLTATGIRTSVGQISNDLTTRYSTTEQTASAIRSIVASNNQELASIYSTQEQTANRISSAVSAYDTSLSSRLTNYSTRTQTATDISQAVSSIENELESYSTLTQTATSIAAAISTYDSGVQNTYTSLALFNGRIQTLISDYQTDRQNYSTLTQTATAITAKVEAIKIGSRNYLKNSTANVSIKTMVDNVEVINNFQNWSKSSYTEWMLSSEYSSAAAVQKHNGQNIIFFRSTGTQVSNSYGMWNDSVLDTADLKSGDDITVSLWYYLAQTQKTNWTSEPAYEGGYVRFSISVNDGTNNVAKTLEDVNKDTSVGWHYISKTYKIGTDFNNTLPTTRFRFAVYHHGPGIIRFSEVKIEKSNKASDWSAAPEDEAGEFERAWTKIEQTATSIESVASTLTGYDTRITQNATSISTMASSLSGYDTRITQNATAISLEAGRVDNIVDPTTGLVNQVVNSALTLTADNFLVSFNDRNIMEVTPTAADFNVKTLTISGSIIGGDIVNTQGSASYDVTSANAVMKDLQSFVNGLGRYLTGKITINIKVPLSGVLYLRGFKSYLNTAFIEINFSETGCIKGAIYSYYVDHLEINGKGTTVPDIQATSTAQALQFIGSGYFAATNLFVDMTSGLYSGTKYCYRFTNGAHWYCESCNASGGSYGWYAREGSIGTLYNCRGGGPSGDSNRFATAAARSFYGSVIHVCGTTCPVGNLDVYQESATINVKSTITPTDTFDNSPDPPAPVPEPRIVTVSPRGVTPSGSSITVYGASGMYKYNQAYGTDGTQVMAWPYSYEAYVRSGLWYQDGNAGYFYGVWYFGAGSNNQITTRSDLSTMTAASITITRAAFHGNNESNKFNLHYYSPGIDRCSGGVTDTPGHFFKKNNQNETKLVQANVQCNLGKTVTVNLSATENSDAFDALKAGQIAGFGVMGSNWMQFDPQGCELTMVWDS